MATTISVEEAKNRVIIHIDKQSGGVEVQKPQVQSSGASASPQPAQQQPPAQPVVTGSWTAPNNPFSLKPLSKAIPSSTPSRDSGGTADVLVKERKKATFNIEALTNVLDGGVEKTKRRRFIISPNKDLDLPEKYYWTRHEALKNHVKHFIGMHEPWAGKLVPTREDVTWMTENSIISGTLMNHYGLFMPTILSQASDEQMGWWLPRAMMFKIIGGYGQTELGHGSNVRGLQATAHYDKKTQEFILNTPTLTSIKWWPGALGKVGTHAVVYAELILDGKEYGVNIFMVQLRDENHRPLPGIELGDLGPKLGDHANDTGFLRLENVRIPREHMLSRYQSVDEKGNFIKSSKKTNDKIHYATMMFTRGSMVRGAGGMLAKAVTIATRYSCVRRQGFVDTATQNYASEERQIIDYQIQRYRLLKNLSLAYAMKFCGKWMVERFAALEGDIQGGLSIDTTELPEIAATSAGLKGLCTFLASQGIEDCRKCCGGNGYLLSSGVAALSQDYLWQTTAEGDWIILMLQTARFLNKTLQDAKKGAKLSFTCDYLSPFKNPKFDVKSSQPAPAKSKNEFLNLDYLLRLFRYRALFSIVEVSKELDSRISKDQKYDEAWNSCAVELVNSVRAHCFNFILNNFISTIQGVKEPAIKQVLTQLCALYATTNLLEETWVGFFDHSQVRFIREAINDLLEQLRPNAVPLVDAFDIPDRVLNSTLGRYDGNVYESLYEAAKRSELNSRDPFDGYYEYLRPQLDLEFLSLRNGKIPSHL